MIILVNDPDWQTHGLEGPFGGRAMTYYGRWTYKYRGSGAAGRGGGLDRPRHRPRLLWLERVENSWTGPQPYMQTPNDGADQTAMNGWLTNDAARRLLGGGGPGSRCADPRGAAARLPRRAAWAHRLGRG